MLSQTHDQEDRLARGLERMLKEVDPRDIALLALDSLFDLLPAVFGFAVVESPSDRFACLVTKRFELPESFQHMERGTWTYYVYSRSLEPLYLDGATSRDTAMPILCEGEPFATGAVTYLVPLQSSGQQFGVFGLVGKPEMVFPEEDRLAAERFIKQTAALMKLAQINFFNKENAIKDGLTDLHNRRHFEERVQEEFQRSQRTGAPLSLVMLDIDHFKRINDTYGHAVGDQTLRAVAQCARSALRSIDQIYRYGGEEFAVILPGCPLAEAVMVAERARQALASLPAGPEGPVPERITLSAGAASCPNPNPTVTGLLRSADAALYEAKRKGRNRVEPTLS
jgi:diguanylate cyclase (GGDEF)-like protein